MTTEQTFYTNEDGVRITTTRAIFGSTTYLMANITSVTRDEEPAIYAGNSNLKGGILLEAGQVYMAPVVNSTWNVL